MAVKEMGPASLRGRPFPHQIFSSILTPASYSVNTFSAKEVIYDD